MPQDSRAEKPRRWEWVSLAALLAIVVLFGFIVELRSAYLSRRMGDLGVYLRAAWAVRTGNNLYDITCNNGWHYHYPPLFAILMMPLADPPMGFDSKGMTPYPLSVAIFYMISLTWLALAIHWLAKALEETEPQLGSAAGNRRWLYLRLFPLYACLLPIGHSLSRGQVTTLWMLILAGMLAGVLRGRRLTAGLWLAGAICLKIIPAYLLIYPVWRRDARFLAGSALGLVVGLGIIPAAVMGPRTAWESYCHLADVLIAPALGVGNNESRTTELLGVDATNNVSFQATIHHLFYGITDDPHVLASPWVRGAHWLVGGLLTLATLAAAGWRRPSDPMLDAVFLGSLAILNLLISPVCHTLYFGMLAGPLALLLALDWRERDSADTVSAYGGLAVSRRMALLAVAVIIFNAIPLLPVLESFRNLGLTMYVVLMIWLFGCGAMRRMRRKYQMISSEPKPLAA